MIDLSKKVTMATIKSFVKKNRDRLLIDTESRFDSMCDGVRSCEDRGFTAVREGANPENTLGIAGAWFVGGSRNSLTPFSKNGLEGYRVYNCCGSFSLAVRV